MENQPNQANDLRVMAGHETSEDKTAIVQGDWALPEGMSLEDAVVVEEDMPYEYDPSELVNGRVKDFPWWYYDDLDNDPGPWDDLVVIDQDIVVPEGWEIVDMLRGYKLPWQREKSDAEAHREEAHAAEMSPPVASRIAERLALRAEIGPPDPVAMKGRARRWLASLRRARVESVDDLRALQAEVITLANDLIAEIGDATLLANKYKCFVTTDLQSEDSETFTLDRWGTWHCDYYFSHKGVNESYSGDIDLAPDALRFVRHVAESNYAARCLADIAFGDPGLAACGVGAGEVDPGDPDTHEFCGIDEPADTPRV